VGLDAADAFVHSAVRAYAGGLVAPEPPASPAWVERAVPAGVLLPVARQLARSSWPVPAALAGLEASVAARHLRSLGDLRLLAAALDEAAIPCAVLKGPVLREEVFRDGARDYTDLDVLVRGRDLRATVTALSGAGARLLPADWARASRARTAELAMELRHGTVLDLHVSLVNKGAARSGFGLRTAALLERRVPCVLGGASATRLDDLDLVLHVLLHACLSGAHQLRWLLDVQQCLGWLTTSPAALAGRAAELGLSLPGRVVLDAVALYVDPAAEPWAEAMTTATPWTRTLAEVSARRPPSAPSVTTRSSRRWYAATRRTEAGSWAAAAGSVAAAVRHTRRPWSEPSPAATSERDAGYLRWVEVAERVE
jgi:hypothetical protein